MKLLLLDGIGKKSIDELNSCHSFALTEILSRTLAEICADSLSRFWCIDSVCVISPPEINQDTQRKLPCYKSVSALFKTFGKSLCETTFIIAESHRMMLPESLPMVEKVRLLQPCFLCDGNNKKVLCVIKGSVLYEAASRKNPHNLNELYNLLKSERIKTSVFLMNGEFSPLNTPNSLRNYAFTLFSSEICDGIKEKQDGVFYADRIPSGNYVAVPPVYFGKNVQIETGAVIGPFTLIGDSCLVSEGARIENSVLCSDVYVSKDCYLNGAVIGEGCSLRRNCAVLQDAVIGESSLIGEGSVIERGCSLPPSSVIGNDYDYFENENDRFCEKLLIDEQKQMPEDAAKIGKMFARYTAGALTAVINDGSVSSYLLKNAFIAGACYESSEILDCGEGALCQTVFAGAILNAAFTVFISASYSGHFSFFDSFGRPFTRREVCEMCSRTYAKKENEHPFEFPLFNGSWRSSYTDSLFEKLNAVNSVSPFTITCENSVLNFVLSAFKGFECNGNPSAISFKVNKNSDRLSAEYNQGEFSHETLLSVAALFELRRGSVIKLPWNAPSFLAEINEFNSKIDFGESCGTFDGAWAFDPFFLAVEILEALSVTGKNLTELSEDIPDFFIAEKSVDINVQPCKLTEMSDADMLYSDGIMRIKTEHGTAKIKRDMYRNKLHIITEAVNSEFSEELTGEVMKIINNAALDNNCN